jgi:hypothetical protein
MAGRRHFGSIRKRASGRYQARYTGPDNKTYNAPETFERKTDAARWLSLREAEITRGDWINLTRERSSSVPTRGSGSKTVC